MQTSRLALVEDHAMVRQLLAQLIVDELGLALVAECESAAEALSQLPTAKPDLALVDCQLLDGRGTEVIRSLRLMLPRTRWLLLSASDTAPTVRAAASAGVHGFVHKRANLAVLRDAIKRVLAGEIYYCPFSSHLLTTQIVAESTTTVALTSREREVLRGFARGESAKHLADRLGMHVKTVQNHLTALRDKLGLREPALLVRYAMENGYVDGV